MYRSISLQRLLSSTLSVGALGVCSTHRWSCPLSNYAAAQTTTTASPSVLHPTSYVIGSGIPERRPHSRTASVSLSAVAPQKLETPLDAWMTDITLPKEIDLHDSSRWQCTIYQFESCPFCRKVRACLDYFHIPYHIVEVHPLSKKELKGVTDYRKVPVLTITDIQTASAPPIVLKDSKAIVHALFAHESPSLVPVDQEVLDAERAWVRWSDEVLVQLIVMNIYRNLKESAETFNYLLTHPQFSLFERHSAQLMGTLVMWLVSKRKKSKYQVIDERASLYAALNAFLEAKGSAPFHGGSKPNEADINVYGILRSIESFSCEKDILHYTKVGAWMHAMEALTQSPSCTKRAPRESVPCSSNA